MSCRRPLRVLRDPQDGDSGSCPVPKIKSSNFLTMTERPASLLDGVTSQTFDALCYKPDGRRFETR
jgi:hypothetical protein